jgi:SAM-dependent methyltransferase
MDRKRLLEMVDEGPMVIVDGGMRMVLPFPVAYILTNDKVLNQLTYSKRHFDLFTSPDFVEIARPYARTMIEATGPSNMDDKKTFVAVYEAVFDCHADCQYDIMKRLLKPSGKETVLEVGCASGNLTIKLARDVGHVTAVDTSEAFIERARQKGKEVGVDNVDFIVKRYPFDVNEDFDYMIAFGCPLEPGRIPASKAAIGVFNDKRDTNKECARFCKSVMLSAKKFDKFRKAEIVREEWPSIGNVMETVVLYMEKADRPRPSVP